jgi:hypothetical protein
MPPSSRFENGWQAEPLQHAPPKRRLTFNRLYGVISSKTEILNLKTATTGSLKILRMEAASPTETSVVS